MPSAKATLLAAVAAAAAAPLAGAALGPEQLNLALTAGGPTEMAVSWVSLDAWSAATHGSVTWAPASAPSQQASAPARTHTYTAGFGWTGSIFWATMTGLVPGEAYTYTVEANGNASAPRGFLAAPAPNASAIARVAVLADMGTVELLGFEVAAELIREHTAQPFDLTFISGDLSYATVDPPKNEFQFLWDAWGVQDEPFASTAPFMMTVGNHGALQLQRLLRVGGAAGMLRMAPTHPPRPPPLSFPLFLESTPGKLTNSSGTFDVEFAAFTSRWQMPLNGRCVKGGERAAATLDAVRVLCRRRGNGEGRRRCVGRNSRDADAPTARLTTRH